MPYYSSWSKANIARTYEKSKSVYIRHVTYQQTCPYTVNTLSGKAVA